MHEKLIHKLTDFIQFEREVRAASSVNALGFTACNYLHKLLDYDVALLLVDKSGKQRVNTVSGVSEFDLSSPLVLASEALCQNKDIPLDNVRVHVSESLPVPVARKFEDIQLQQVATAGLIEDRATLVLGRSNPWQKHELQLLQQVSEVLGHSMNAFNDRKTPAVVNKILPGIKPNWRWAVFAGLLLSFVPVPQSIIASAEVTARSPSVVSSGLNGVIDDILVRPNERVSKGQLLVQFDSTDLTHRKRTLENELALAEERLRKARQHSLNTTIDRSEFAELASQIELKNLELNYVEETIKRLELRAQSDGVVLFSRKQDWLGRSVVIGEKIMQIATADDSQFEIWVAANDAIDISEGKSIKFFPEAQPLQSVKGSVESVGFFASNEDTEQLSYRVLADPTDDYESLRLGMKGTARLYGERASLAYHLLRKPISAIRKHAGV